MKIDNKAWMRCYTKKELYYKGKPDIILRSYRQYCNESFLFRVLVKLGLRK